MTEQDWLQPGTAAVWRRSYSQDKPCRVLSVSEHASIAVVEFLRTGDDKRISLFVQHDSLRPATAEEAAEIDRLLPKETP